jgi:hypothetical protein
MREIQGGLKWFGNFDLLKLQRASMLVVGADQKIIGTPPRAHSGYLGLYHGIDSADLATDFPGDFY